MKLKNLFLTVLIGIFAVVLVACDNNGGDDEVIGFEHNFELHDMSNYSVEGEHSFYYVTMDEALQLVEDPDFNGVFYFGFPGCPWCQAGVPVLFEAMQETGVPVFYVSRSRDLREGAWLEWDEEMAWWLNEQIEDMRWLYLDDEDNETTDETDTPLRPNIFVPHVVHVRSGRVISNHRGTFEDHDPTYPLADEQHATLLATYVQILSGVTETPPCNILDETVTECD